MTCFRCNEGDSFVLLGEGGDEAAGRMSPKTRFYQVVL